MNILKKTFKAVLFLIVALLLGFIGLILYAVITDYKPKDEELISKSDNPSILKDSSIITLLTWNIGYAGLDKDMDFFKDGGTKVITTKEKSLNNISRIGDFLSKNDTIDFIMIQEIDRKSKRSYKVDQYSKIEGLLSGHHAFFAKNYDVFFVPAPPTDPIGKVFSGIAVYSKFIPESSERYPLPGDFGFPMQLFYLDRCFMVNRYKVANGKELVIINTHNEAFDAGGNIRKDQMEYMKKFVVNEYKQGNYVIAGGDWNQYPPNFKPAFTSNKGFTGQSGNFFLMGIETDYLPGEWKWVYDPSTPSFRTVFAAYNPETTPTSICDIFLISPNVESLSVKCQQLDFTNSDHNPVIVRVKLKV